jgi:hypothetical protein
MHFCKLKNWQAELYAKRDILSTGVHVNEPKMMQFL